MSAALHLFCNSVPWERFHFSHFGLFVLCLSLNLPFLGCVRKVTVCSDFFVSFFGSVGRTRAQSLISLRIFTSKAVARSPCLSVFVVFLLVHKRQHIIESTPITVVLPGSRVLTRGNLRTGWRHRRNSRTRADTHTRSPTKNAIHVLY